MGDIRYDEIVTLLRAGGYQKDMPLAEAMRTIINMGDMREQMMHSILRDDGPPIRELAEVRAIYSRPDFPKFDVK